MEELQRELRNAKDRERRLKKTVKFLIEELQHKNMLTKELQQELDFYSGWLNRTASFFFVMCNVVIVEINVLSHNFRLQSHYCSKIFTKILQLIQFD